jgi:hypothetical protein
MLWLVTTAAGVGILFGLRLQVASVIAASAVIALTALVLMPFGEASLVEQLAFTGLLLFALQCGYLAGLAIFVTWTRGISGRGANYPIVGSRPSASPDGPGRLKAHHGHRAPN